jgi:hypothetical protein
VDLCGQIPGYLTSVLGLQPITLAVVRETKESDPALFFCCASDAMPVREPASVPPNVLNIYRQTRPLTRADGLVLRSMYEIDQGPTRRSEDGLVDYSRALVFALSLDEVHRMLLVIHQRRQDLPLSDAMTDMLLIIARHLARLLSCLVTLHTRPRVIGKNFALLTEKHWSVLKGLDSDLGEKQLAEQLGISPHTLHSHIKSVYRRLGVQGRLSMLKQLEEACRSWRIAQMNAQVPKAAPLAFGHSAAAAG